MEESWQNVLLKVEEVFGKKPDMQAVLYLIGVQELGDLKRKFTKEEKQDLMHIAVCKLLSQVEYYQFDMIDDDGWPHYSPTEKYVKHTLEQQEALLKEQIIEYFKTN